MNNYVKKIAISLNFYSEESINVVKSLVIITIILAKISDIKTNSFVSIKNNLPNNARIKILMKDGFPIIDFNNVFILPISHLRLF